MKTKYELSQAARALAESLHGETNQKKIKALTIAQFDRLGLDDADFPAFEQMLYQYKATNEGLAAQPLITETMRLEAERKAAVAAKAAEPKAEPA